jgi:hypothetical protein
MKRVSIGLNVGFVVLWVTVLFQPVCVFGVTTPVTTDKQEGAFPLVSQGLAAVFVIDPNDAEVVSIAAQAVCDDIRLVTGVAPTVVKQLPAQSKAIVLAGTVGKNLWLDKIIKDKNIDTEPIQGNPWETYLITVVEKPLPGIDTALVIVGSDRRGTAYGLFELSAMAGVSPWAWWADVTPDKQKELYVKPGLYTFGPPSIKYRGIFLNDEDFGLKPWAVKTYEPEVGNIGPKTYAKICELILRLKGNYLWPAMHECTGAFNDYPGNKVVADRYAIAMGSSHCEPLLFNTATEWNKQNAGPWQYDINRERILKVLDRRISENGKYENVYTMGMRGVHDSGMVGNLPMPQKVTLMHQIFHDEREILERYTNLPAAKIPQIFVPYKEVLPIYDAGLKVPTDITLVWVDDNHGYIRRFSNDEERKRPGGAGVYYHISYWGAPHCYLWLETTPPILIWKELMRLYETGGRTLWVVNVGDIKPGESGTEFFLQMAWDINRWNEDNVKTYPATMAGREFGQEFAKEIGDILNTYYVLNFQRRPEFMGFNRSYPAGAVNDPQFSLFNYGDECTKRIEAFEALLKQAESVYDRLPKDKKDAYYQLVLYPVFGAAKMNDKILSAYRSREYAKQGRVSANLYAEQTKQAYETIQSATVDYNKIAGGKWQYMMSSEPRSESVFKLPPTGQVDAVKSGMLGVAIEGKDKVLGPTQGIEELVALVPDKTSDDKLLKPGQAVLRFYGTADEKYFIDLFNYGAQSVAWKISSLDNWIQLSKVQGTLEKNDQRIWIHVIEAKLSANKDNEGTIRVEGGQMVYEIAVEVPKKTVCGVDNCFGQQNGIISINAGDAAASRSVLGRQWKPIGGLGRSGNAMGLFPLTGWYCQDNNKVKTECPEAKYPIAVSAGGKAKILLQSVPAFPLQKGQKIQCAVSLDDGPAQWISFEMGGAEGSGKNAQQAWDKNVLGGMMEGRADLQIPTGLHVLHIWGTDPTVMLDKIILNFTEMPSGYLGPPPTRIR